MYRPKVIKKKKEIINLIVNLHQQQRIIAPAGTMYTEKSLQYHALRLQSAAVYYQAKLLLRVHFLLKMRFLF